MSERKQINFTIVPDESGNTSRTYANFCAIAHTPFDFTLTFCEVLPPSEKDVRETKSEAVPQKAVPNLLQRSAPTTHRELRAPVRARIVVPIQFVPNLIALLQEHLQAFSESAPKDGLTKEPVH